MSNSFVPLLPELIRKARLISEFSKSTGSDLVTLLKNNFDGRYFFGSDIEKFDFFVDLFQGKIRLDSSYFLEQRCNLPYHRDSRQSLSYAVELAFGWIIEDLLLEYAKKFAVRLVLNGADIGREFLDIGAIDTRPDFKVGLAHKQVELELVVSYDRYWTETDMLDLRESKLKKIVEHDCLLLGLELSSNRGFLIDAKNAAPHFVARSNPAWGGKSVKSLKGVSKNLVPMATVIERLREESGYLQRFR